MKYHDKSWHFVIKIKNIILLQKHAMTAFLSQKARNYGIFVTKIYDYALFDSFWGSAGFIDSPTSYATLLLYSIVVLLDYQDDKICILSISM